jgi:hypothetical protein
LLEGKGAVAENISEPFKEVKEVREVKEDVSEVIRR